MFSTFFLFFGACTSLSFEEKSEETIVEITVDGDSLMNSTKEILTEVEELWKKRSKKEKREAQKKLQDFYEKEGQYMFSLLHQDHPEEVMAAEHQLGWVIHRLHYHTSRSFRRESGYLEKLSQKLQVCADLLPEPTLEIDVESQKSDLTNTDKGKQVDTASSLSSL